jgi:hypothetical protein
MWCVLATACSSAQSGHAGGDTPGTGPTIDAVCAHVAPILVRASPKPWTETDARASCAKFYGPYREEDAQWDCWSACLSAATSKDELHVCADRCKMPVPDTSCAQVFTVDELATGLGAAVGPGSLPSQEVQLDPSSGRCHVYARTRAGADQPYDIQLSMDVQDTQAQARKLAGTEASPCRVDVARGRVVLGATIYDRKAPCDAAGLQRALELVAQRITVNGRIDPGYRGVPPPQLAVRPPAPLPDSCANVPDVQPLFAPLPRARGGAPSPEAVCARWAQLAAKANALPDDRAGAAKDCVDGWKQYRSDEGADRWACEASCRANAPSYDKLADCDDRCVPVNPMHWECTVHEDELATALGHAASVDRERSQLEAKEATIYFTTEPAFERLHVSLYVHGSKQETASQMTGLGILHSCQAARARGHVFAIVDGPDTGTCDRAALERVADAVLAHVGE